MKESSRSLENLTPETKEKALRVIELCKEYGVNILITSTFRSLSDQARLFCNGHTHAICGRRAHKLRYGEAFACGKPSRHYTLTDGFPELAAVLEKEMTDSDSAYGRPPVTNAAPGESFHNYGMAFDAVPLVNGRCVWDVKSHLWQVYGEAVKAAGLYWAGNWSGRRREYPHAQLYEQGNPLRIWNRDTILKNLVNAGALSGQRAEDEQTSGVAKAR